MHGILSTGVSRRGVFFVSGWARGFTSALVVMLICAVIAPVSAQRYKTLPQRLTDREGRTLRGKVRQVINSSDGFGAAQAEVKDFFGKYFFPKMTDYSPEGLAELGDSREDLFKLYVRKTPSQASHTALTRLCLIAGKEFSQGNYHPAVRYNGALILGNLDSKITPAGQPPAPLSEATALLLDLLEQADFNGVKVHPSVKTGALVGLERHARYGIDPQYAQRVTEAVLDVIAEEDLPEGMTKDVHHWMKSLAAGVLVQQFRETPGAEVQTVLDAIITNDDFSVEDRCYVTALMENLNYEQAEGINTAATLDALGNLSQEVLKIEAKLAKDYQKEVLAGAGGGGFRRRGGLRGGLDDQVKYERRQLLSRLRAIYDAGMSLKNGFSEEFQGQVTELLDAMKPVRLAAADDKTTDLDVADKVLQAVPEVNRVIQSWSAGELAEQPVEADFS